MSENRLAAYLDQMRSAAVQACSFVEGMTQDDFLGDKRTQMAVSMALVLIGENAARIMNHYPDIAVNHPYLPWNKIKDMRNLVVHDYYQLELPIVLATVRESLPKLISELDALRNWRAQGE